MTGRATGALLPARGLIVPALGLTTAPGWSPDLAPGQSVTIGYQANGQAGSPSGFTLNGAQCS